MAYTKVTGALVGSLSDLDLTNVGDIQLDSISGDADTNTSITFSGSDVITIATGGTTALTVDANQKLTANSGVAIDNITIDGTEIDLSSGDLTLDVAGDIILDADGGDVKVSDGGTHIGTFTNSSSDFVITSAVQDKDIILKGDDGGSAVTALTVDMSEGGNVGIGTTTATNAKLEVVATSGEVFRADANNGAYRLVANQNGVIMNGNVGIAETSPDRPLHICGPDGTTGLAEGNSRTALFLDNAGATYINLASANNANAGLFFSDPDANNRGGVIYEHGSDALTFDTAGAERMRIDANGRFGVGGTPVASQSNSTSIQIIAAATATDDYTNNDFNDGSLLSLNADNDENHYASIRFTHEGNTEGFFGYVRQTASTDIADFLWQGYEGDSNTYREYMRLTHAGHLAINGANSGTTGANKTAAAYSTLTVQTGSSNGDVATAGAFSHVGPINTASNANADGYISGMSFGYFEGNNSYRHTAIAARAHGDGAARRDMVFLVNSTSEAASAELGDAKLTISSGNGVVSGDLNDTSDLGFKENVADLGNTLSIVKQLKPRTFTWKDEKAARGDSVGFIAQEVKSVVSDNTLVQGEEYDPDNLKMTGLSLNTVGLVAYLTKAIQELSAELDAAKARITTLEG